MHRFRTLAIALALLALLAIGARARFYFIAAPIIAGAVAVLAIEVRAVVCELRTRRTKREG